MAYRLAALRWLRGRPVAPSPDDEIIGGLATLLGAVVSPRQMTEWLADLHFGDVAVWIAKGRSRSRGWASGRKLVPTGDRPTGKP